MIKIIICIVMLNLVAGCQVKDESGKSVAESSVSFKERGEKLFMHHCAPCHGKLAHGGVAGPDLTATRFKYGKNPADIKKTIAQGRPGGMPAFGSQLKQEEINALTDYLLSLK